MMRFIFILAYSFFALSQTESPVCDDHDKIYKVCSDQEAMFKKALADNHGKSFAIVFGADWCPWCISLHHILKNKNPMPFIDIGLYKDKEKVSSGFAVLEKIESLAKVKAPKGLPILAVIHSGQMKAKLINTEPLEKNTKTTKGHDPEKVIKTIKNIHW